ncbi:MAG TPA: phage tail protein [Ignavibacteria bacterium]|nr:phage tail protein [Ignavibacteria bacterium]HQY52209.1 phage tail protein [Ignavibacteria bacterium]
MTIKLLNDEHSPVVKWKVRDSFPVNYSGLVLEANSSEIAMEVLEISHERLTVETV